MLLANALLALSLVGSPERNCVAPSQTGIFRITAMAKDSSSANVGLVLLENVANCLEASIMIQGGGPTFIDKVKLDGDQLTGELHMTAGTAKVAFTLGASEIKGSIVDGKKAWQISGRRTGGLDTRMANGEVIR